MPRWRLYARDAEGWLDLNEIIDGEQFDAEAACARASAWRGLPVCAEPELKHPENENEDERRGPEGHLGS
jgi:hypothetical protein